MFSQHRLAAIAAVVSLVVAAGGCSNGTQTSSDPGLAGSAGTGTGTKAPAVGTKTTGTGGTTTKDAGAADPDQLSRQLMLVFAGAQSQALVQRSPKPVRDARQVARALVDASV